jgi:SPP1 gp7 family putative phage head morphogenesis protein
MAAVLEKGVTATEEAATEMIFLALLLLRYGAHLRRLTAARLDEIEEQVLKALAVADLAGPRRYRMADQTAEQLMGLIQPGFGTIQSDLLTELTAMAALVSEFLTTQIDTATLPGVGRPLAEDNLADAARTASIDGAVLAIWLSRVAGDLVFRLRRVISTAAADSRGATEVTKSIQEAFEASRRNTRPIVQTAVTAVMTTTVERMVFRNSDVLKGYVHVSVLDWRTTKLICRPRAGKRWLADGTPVGHAMPFRRPPLHMSCRSHLAPWFKPLRELPGHVAAPLREAGRGGAFRDSPVVEPTLAAWLESRPVAEQKAVVGASRWSAWKRVAR